MAVLILTNSSDHHAAAVSEAVNVNGGKSVVVFVDHLASGDWLPSTATFFEEDQTLELEGVRYTSSDFSSVFVHRAYPLLDSALGRDELDRAFVQTSWRAFVRNIDHFLEECLWVNSPELARRAARVNIQYKLARRSGFDVPHTIITNSLPSVRALCEECGDIVLKTGPLPDLQLPQDTAIYTQRFSRTDLDEISDRLFSGSPCVVQEYVDKAYEIRVYVIGERVLACKIESQANSRTRVDWRRYNLSATPHSPMTLSKKVKDACLGVAQGLGLVFASLDLAVKPDGSIYFFEINPGGSWLWIEKLAGLPLTEYLVELLLTGRSAVSAQAAPARTTFETIGGLSAEPEAFKADRASGMKPNGSSNGLPVTSLRDFSDDIWDSMPCLLRPENLIPYSIDSDEVIRLFSEHGTSSPQFTLYSSQDESTESSRFRLLAALQENGSEKLKELATSTTLIIRGVNRFSMDVERSRSYLQRFFGCKVTANLYHSHSDVPGFPPHADTHHVLVAQVAGEKDWYLWEKVAYHPFAPITVEDASRAEAAWKTKTGPGEVLYIPWGLLHEAACRHGVSVHITFGIIPPTFSSQRIDQATKDSYENPASRRSLPYTFDPSVGFTYER